MNNLIMGDVARCNGTNHTQITQCPQPDRDRCARYRQIAIDASYGEFRLTPYADFWNGKACSGFIGLNP